ncbi:hypothetical protein K0504_01660 [Neiella marina]|uniref:Uncharacterized protein n=1 Tax=Neiella holothuriorum TaxID=2870530 RepID=A0ABS7ECP8_9GAMM|nr:hypothetical protein [Neiella holothuriorum]MBW8189728.1 hypothetical protein [Neiella holothuriorum]
MADKAQKAYSHHWLKRTLFSPESQLIVWTLFFGAVTFILFWLTIKWQLMPAALVKPYISQEDTGIFDALGGWALGFAGALVAIRIAGLTASIQQNDSIREQVKVWAEHVDRISTLNSRLTRSISDAKRASAAVLLHAKEIYHEENIPAFLTNTLSGKPKSTVKSQLNHDPESRLQEKLEDKLEVLVETIEEAFKDSIFRSVLYFTAQQEQESLSRKPNFSKASKSTSESESNHQQENYVDTFFESEEARIAVERIVREDDDFFNVLNVISGLNKGVRNFGIGLMELRAMPLFDHFRQDLLRISSFQQKKSKSADDNLEIAEAAWLFLGLLLSRRKRDNSVVSQNDGFVIIALLLGSLPTEETIEQYLSSKFKESEKTYSKVGKALMVREIEELSKQLYYVKGEELSELADLIIKCSNNLAYLNVLTKSTAVSAAYEEKYNIGSQGGSDNANLRGGRNQAASEQGGSNRGQQRSDKKS